MYKKFTIVMLIALMSFASSFSFAAKTDIVILEGIVTASTISAYEVEHYVVWEIAVGKSYFDTDSCENYPCAELESISGPGSGQTGIATTDGQVFAYVFERLFFGFKNKSSSILGDGYYLDGDNSMQFDIISREVPVKKPKKPKKK